MVKEIKTRSKKEDDFINKGETEYQETPKASKSIGFKMDAELHQLLEQASKSSGRSKLGFIRYAIKKQAEKELELT
jgi:uncharacterized protein (DUF1778 family)